MKVVTGTIITYKLKDNKIKEKIDEELLKLQRTETENQKKEKKLKRI